MRAVVLTKSNMSRNNIKGYCVVAMDLSDGSLVRLVSDRRGSPMPYYVGNFFDLLDEVEIGDFVPCPDGPQSENIFVDTADLRGLGPHPGGLDHVLSVLSVPAPGERRFMDSTGYKLTDVAGLRHSLEIVPVKNMVIERFGQDDRAKAGFFTYSGRHSFYRITDPAYDIRKLGTDRLVIPSARIAVSISAQPYIRDSVDYGYFKFIAAVYT